jgi:hypothetical protein
MDFSLLLGRIPDSGRVEIIAILSDNVTLPNRCFMQTKEARPLLAIPAKVALRSAGGCW